MSYLAGFLDARDGARLTSVAVLPFAHETRWRLGHVTAHRVLFGDHEEPSAAIGAIATLLPTAAATATGFDPDGHTWGAVFQCAPRDRQLTGAGPSRPTPPIRTMLLAEAGLDRAMDLTGVTGKLSAQCAGDDDLRAIYAGAGGHVAAWTLGELLGGLLVELATEADLGEIAALAESGAPEATEAERLARILRPLRDWSSTYEGREL